jgi:hypothetical protein
MNLYEFEKVEMDTDRTQYFLNIGPYVMYVYQDDGDETFGFDLDGEEESLKEDGDAYPESFKIPNAGYKTLEEAKQAVLEQCHILCSLALQDIIDARKEYNK